MGTTEPIRAATDSDSDSIANLIAELRMEEHGTSLDRVGIASVVRSAIACATTSVLVAGTGGGVRGFIVVHWLPFPMLGGTEAYISDVIVGRESRGQGIGRDLLAAAEREARARSCLR